MKKTCKIVKTSLAAIVVFLICKDIYFICKEVFDEYKVVKLPNGQKIEIANTDVDTKDWEKHMVENGCILEQSEDTLYMKIGEDEYTINP